MPSEQENAGTKTDLLRVREAVKASGDVAYEWDLRTDRVIWASEPCALREVLSGRVPETGTEFLRCIIPDDLLARRRAFSDHINEDADFDCEYRVGLEDGGFVWIHERGSARLDEDGAPERLMGTLRIITSRKQRERQLHYHVHHDRLTGLFNRARLGEELEAIVEFNQQFDKSGLYVAIGIDRLSVINDAFGPETGDAILRELAGRLDTWPPLGEVLGRVGGDCFGLVVAHCPQKDIDGLADRILEAMRSEPVETPNGPVYVTASVGGVCVDGHTASAHDVMAKAEVALREAKGSGRDCFVLYDTSEAVKTGAQQSAAIVDKVWEALRQNKLCFAFQPIVDSNTEEVSHYEALLRMIDSDGQLVSAGAFMPVIEEMGLIRQIDRKVLDLTVSEMCRDPAVRLAINVSGLTACDRGWIARLAEIARVHPDIPGRLIIELTETVALRDIKATARFVNELREIGCEVALDDFGAGFSSFRNLRAFTVDVVKIDGSFVRNIAEDGDNQLFIKSLVGLARGFSLRTVAECVETRADASELRRQGVDYLQGYYFGKPEPVRPADQEAVDTAPATDADEARPTRLSGSARVQQALVRR